MIRGFEIIYEENNFPKLPAFQYGSIAALFDNKLCLGKNFGHQCYRYVHKEHNKFYSM